eukprot:3266253-Amphidinium_carterae.1
MRKPPDTWMSLFCCQLGTFRSAQRSLTSSISSQESALGHLDGSHRGDLSKVVAACSVKQASTRARNFACWSRHRDVLPLLLFQQNHNRCVTSGNMKMAELHLWNDAGDEVGEWIILQ